MATKKQSTNNSTKKKSSSKSNNAKVKKFAKKYPKLFIAIAVVVAIAIVTIWVLDRTNVITIPFLHPEDKTEEHYHPHTGDDGCVEDIVYDDFQIHFLELGNEYTGDSVYIKAGDNDILIDAGSRGNSAAYINDYVKKYCTDGVLEYVIATHNHQDHIAGFAGVNDTKATNFKGEKTGKTGVLYYFDVETLIDFTYAGVNEKVDGKDKTVTYLNKSQNSSSFGSSTVYGKYLAAREYAISKGTKYFTAKDLWDNNKHLLNLSDSITMDILWNNYYFEESSDINNYSVCSLFSYNDKHYLLTGDLEKEGEEKLANYYDGSTKEKTLPHVELFKGGHHGSYTASNECLLSKVTPSISVCCCCAGATEYTVNNDATFPSQDYINRIAKYTSRVYITTLYDRIEKKNNSMNGNIIISSNGTEVGIYASNNLTRLKDSDWFNEDIYVIDGKVAKGSKGSTDFYTKDDPGVTLIKQRTWPSYGV